MGYGISVFPVAMPIPCMAHVIDSGDSDGSSCNPVGGMSCGIRLGGGFAGG
jgi:hypothetical protein